jgi:hypothetical protein
MTRFMMTPPIVRAACIDAGNRSMRSRGLTMWDAKAWDAATAEYDRLDPRTCPGCGELLPVAERGCDNPDCPAPAPPSEEPR